MFAFRRESFKNVGNGKIKGFIAGDHKNRIKGRPVIRVKRMWWRNDLLPHVRGQGDTIIESFIRHVVKIIHHYFLDLPSIKISI
jgi:hypothetical protein